MNILEICPPKNLVFSIPNDLQRVLTITNLTLRSLYIHILNSHPYEVSLSKHTALMSAFEELKVEVTLNLNQEVLNSGLAKLRVYYYETEEEEDEANMREKAFSPDNNTQNEEITILFDIHAQMINTLHYEEVVISEHKQYECISTEAGSKSYLMRRVYPQRGAVGPKLATILSGERLKNEIFNYLQHLNYVTSIEECENNHTFLIDFKQKQQDICDFVTFVLNDTLVVFAIARIIAYGKPYQIPTLVNIDSDEEPSSPNTNPNPNHHNESSPRNSPLPISSKMEQKECQESIKLTEIVTQTSSKAEDEAVSDKKKRDLTKQSFAVKRQSEKIRNKRRNKSEEKIQEASSEEEEEDVQIRRQMKKMRLGADFDLHPPAPIKIRHEVQIRENNIQLSEKVLNVQLEWRQNCHFIYVLVRDCVRVFMLEDPTYKRVIKFDPIDSANVGMPTPADIYQDELIFGNESYLFWVNLQSGQSEWKYVQRKYIYSLAVIEELSLVAIGGKNFSKLSYFGKETTRSNLKLYSCSASDKHDHLFTYDFPGTNVGHVASLVYLSVPPLGTKLLVAHTVSSEVRSCFFFLRVKAFNKVEVYGELQLDELGILNLLKLKCNRDTGRVVCLQALGDTQVDSFKRLKLKCQYEKVQVSTEGFKLPLKRFISYHLGGAKEGLTREWMSIVEDNGCIFHIFDFQANKLDTYELGKGEIRQVFSLYNGKYLLICSDTAVKIREKVEIEIKE